MSECLSSWPEERDERPLPSVVEEDEILTRVDEEEIVAVVMVEIAGVVMVVHQDMETHEEVDVNVDQECPSQKSMALLEIPNIELSWKTLALVCHGRISRISCAKLEK